MDEPRSSEDATTTSPSNMSVSLMDAHLRQITTDMRGQNFDVIRFASYRTACKLRFVQKKTNLYLVDLWNIIEAFREHNLNALEHGTHVPNAKIEGLLSTIFYQLNKRLPSSSQIDAELSIKASYCWLLSALDSERQGRISVFALKVALSSLCSGKLVDKLRYIFTQISDASGHLVLSKFEDYLRALLCLPTAVYEGPSFGYNDSACRSCFNGEKSIITVNEFLDRLMSDPGPQCLLWLPILHRMQTVENVLHPVRCEACGRNSFTGFRYKCTRCHNYNMCENCFWRGQVSGNHNNDHQVKEYSSYKSPAKQLGHSLKKSLRCVPQKESNSIPRFPETPEKTINLTHIVPATPPPVHNGFLSFGSLDRTSMDSSFASHHSKSPSKFGTIDKDSMRVDDEHRLIARYAARLAVDSQENARSPTEINSSLDANRAQRELIAQLEAKNREIINEIHRLRLEQEQQAKLAPDGKLNQGNPTLLAELRLLRQRRDELEARMSALQESRRELMVQLEGLMKLLKQGSPRSTPTSSPRSRSGHSPPITPLQRNNSLPPTIPPGDSLAGVGGDVRQAFVQAPGSPPGAVSGASSLRSLRNDLLVAADSVTNAMSSLVKELNSEASSGSEEEDEGIGVHPAMSSRQHRPAQKRLVNNHQPNGNHHFYNANHHGMGRGQPWPDELQQRLAQENHFMQQLRARKGGKTASRPSSDTDHDVYMVTDAESLYGRTDEDSMIATDDAESYVKTDDDDYENVAELRANCHAANSHLGAILRQKLAAQAQLAGASQAARANHAPAHHAGVLAGVGGEESGSCLETDQESYIRTDDEDGGNTEWEESMKRWVNR